MGAKGSRVSSEGWKTFSYVRCWSFDALGTLYDFKRPVADQYIQIARQCGVDGPLNPAEVDKWFKIAYKQTWKEFPNYGKGKSNFTPAIWWDTVVHLTFQKVLGGRTIPPDLGARAYQHFATGNAYTLRPDAKVFLAARKRNNQTFLNYSDVSQQYHKPQLCFVITNSDPRVAGILRDLGLKVGEAEPFNKMRAPRFSDFDERLFNPNNDIQFVCTSYESGYEKPDKRIFEYARRQALTLAGSRLVHYRRDLAKKDPLVTEANYMAQLQSPIPDDATWYHIGDEYEKDTRGALNTGIKALHLITDGKISEWQRRAQNDNVVAITSHHKIFKYTHHPEDTED